jgi:hypothetical protein
MSQEDLTFTKFVKHVENTQLPSRKLGYWNIRYHWQPCLMFIPKYIDLIGKVENIQDDIKLIAALFKIDKPLKWKNKTENKKKDYFDDDTDKIVREVFARDIEEFEFERPKYI